MTVQEKIVRAYLDGRAGGLPQDDLTLLAFKQGATAVLGSLADLFKGPDSPSMVTITTTLLQLNMAIGGLDKVLREIGE